MFDASKGRKRKTGAESIGKTDDLNGKYLNRGVEDSIKREGEAK